MKRNILFKLSLFLLFSCILTGCAKTTANQEKDIEVIWEVRNEYYSNDKLLFRVFPDPRLTSGESYEYLIHFTEPFDIFEGKKLGIYAYHKETDERVTAMAPATITKPSPNYSSLERFVTTFELPYKGLWRYEIVLDEEVYGDVILMVN